jgi:hypothetical protein
MPTGAELKSAASSDAVVVSIREQPKENSADSDDESSELYRDLRLFAYD